MQTRYSIVQEPRGRTYRGLLGIAQTICDTASLVVRGPDPIAAEIQSTLRKLEPFLESESELPSVLSIGSPARVFRYRLSERCGVVLCAAVNGLYEWLQPQRPEDLCIIRENVPCLTTIAHERTAYLDLLPDEYQKLETLVPGLVLYAGDFMPPSQELYRLFGGYLDDYFLGKGFSVEAALAKYVTETPGDKLDEVVTAIRSTLFSLKSDAILRVVVERLGAGGALLGNDTPSSILVRVADNIERLKHERS